MKKEKIELGRLMLVGMSTRTRNSDEMNPETSKIGKLCGLYWGQSIANQFQHRATPGVTYSVYTEYESDEHSEYTYFIGEAVTSLSDQNTDHFKTLIIEPSTYQRFTTDAGKMPAVVIEAWQKIWQMKETDFGGKRAYRADFEIYDERASDPAKAVIDIYIGIQE